MPKKKKKKSKKQKTQTKIQTKQKEIKRKEKKEDGLKKVVKYYDLTGHPHPINLYNS